MRESSISHTMCTCPLFDSSVSEASDDPDTPVYLDIETHSQPMKFAEVDIDGGSSEGVFGALV